MVDAAHGVQTVYQGYGKIVSDKVAFIIVIDQSGSMSGGKIEAATATAVLMSEALMHNSSIELYIYGHTGDVIDGESTDIIVYREQGYHKPYALGSCTYQSQNRDGTAIAEILARVRSQTKRKGVMFFIADGAPCASGYGGQKAVEDVKNAVRKAEQEGIHVINIAIESSYDPSKMFKHYVKFTDLSNLGKDISRLMKNILYKTQKIHST